MRKALNAITAIPVWMISAMVYFSICPAVGGVEHLAILAGVYCERADKTNADPLSSGTCRDLCRITHSKWGNTDPDQSSTGYVAGQAAFTGLDVIWVMPFTVNSR